MSLKTLAAGLLLVFAVIFTGVEYITFAIINSPSVNESVLRSLIYFVGPLMVIPVAIKINSGRSETQVTENSIDNPTVSCMGEGCWKRFALEESTYAPLPNPDDITRVNVYRTCPYCGTIIPWIPSVTVRRDKWSQKLPAEVLQNVRRNG